MDYRPLGRTGIEQILLEQVQGHRRLSTSLDHDNT
jgi:hypothetical protein